VRLARLGPLVAVAAAAAIGTVLWTASPDGSPERDRATEPAPVAVTSDAPRRGSLSELVAASDLVVRADVVRTERGRVFGDPEAATAIESRVVALSVTEVLHGTGAEPGGRLLVEEEGWDAEGAPLVVDGLGPSAEGDDAIWFITAVGADEEARYVVVSAQGRYLVEGDRLRGASGDDPLVATLAAMSPEQLAAAVRALP
jgi:hypothetical protein